MSEIQHINRISEQRANTWELTKELLDRAASENRDLDGEEEQAYQRAMADLDRLDATRQQLIEAVERDRKINEAREAAGVRSVFASDPEPEPADDINAQVRALFTGERRSMTFESRVNTTTSSNINAIPTDVLPQWVLYYAQGNVMRDVATVITTQSGEPLNIPTASARSTATIIGEGSSITASDPTYAARSVGAYKVATLLQFSRELAADSGAPVADFLARQAGEALGIATRAYFTTGTGSSQPRGIVLDSTNSSITGPTGKSGAPSGDNIIDLYHAVPIGARQSDGFRFMCNSTTLGAIRKLKADNGTYGSTEYLFTVGLQGGADMILGRPVVVNESMASGTSAKCLIAGDLSRYYIREVGGLVVETDLSYGFANDLITLRALVRTDAVLTDRSAVLYMTGAAS